jgi:hypothetical protein
MKKHHLDTIIYRYIFIVLLAWTLPMRAQTADTTQWHEGPLVHRIEADVLPSAILHTNKYLNGNNHEGRTMNHAFTARLKYAFQLPEGSEKAAIYKDAYQGVGVAYHDFNPQLGNPVSVFVFQGARIKRFTPWLSLNYEWNLGLTFGWHPYDAETNPENKVIGSRVTAYIDADLYLKWRLARWLDFNVGPSFIHFSNGNTTLPNAGLNVVGARMSLAYYINRSDVKDETHRTIPRFHKHISYDVVAYGAWRRQGFDTENGPIALPGKYGVFGFNFNPLYNINHWLNAGVSLDGVYDRSANQYLDYMTKGNESEVYGVTSPPTYKQMALGMSGHAEFVMPYFTINMGIGRYFINAHGDLKIWYQMVALKLNVTRHAFLHIGYSLQDFKYPNHLMIGVGWHFNK